MWIVKILTLFPNIFPGLLGLSVSGKALNNNIWSYDVRDIRDYSADKHKMVDDTAYGGGTGMIIKADVLGNAIDDFFNTPVRCLGGISAPYCDNAPPPNHSRKLAPRLDRSLSRPIDEASLSRHDINASRCYDACCDTTKSPRHGAVISQFSDATAPSYRDVSQPTQLSSASTLRADVSDKLHERHKLILNKENHKKEHTSTTISSISHRPTIYLSPRGTLLTQNIAMSLARNNVGINIICGRFEGIDERILEEFDITEISVGDYVLSSGDVAALVLLDACIRLLPGVLSEDALMEESFGVAPEYNNLVEYPQYTKPRIWRGKGVPDALLSGDHEMIRKWRLSKATEKTLERNMRNKIT